MKTGTGHFSETRIRRASITHRLRTKHASVAHQRHVPQNLSRRL